MYRAFIGHCIGLSTIKLNIDLNFATKSKMKVIFEQDLKNVLRLKSWTKLSFMMTLMKGKKFEVNTKKCQFHRRLKMPSF